jgi:outer membrane biosynthesis protein TonB
MEESGSIFGSMSTIVLVILAVALNCLGVWIGFKIKVKRDTPSPEPHLKPQPEPEPHPGPNPSPHPHPRPGPQPPPAPPRPNPATNFKPTLTLNAATLNPASKEIHMDYQIDSDTPVPPTRTYSVNFTIVMNGKPFTSISENTPFDQGDIGFPKQELLLTTGIGNIVKGVNMQVQAQIHYHENSSPASGVIGSMQSITVQ